MAQMSREIKFRGYVKDISDFGDDVVPHKGHFVFGNRVQDKGFSYIVGGMAEANDEYASLEYWQAVGNENVDEFTGLKDANGKEIYEGDIVKFSDDLAIVKFGEFGVPDARTEEYVDKALGFYFDPKVSLSDIEPFSMTIPVNELYACCTEVIGNVHTNPELLEEQHED